MARAGLSTTDPTANRAWLPGPFEGVARDAWRLGEPGFPFRFIGLEFGVRLGPGCGLGEECGRGSPLGVLQAPLECVGHALLKTWSARVRAPPITRTKYLTCNYIKN